MIDICPVGALTSKPFRYSARTWELGRRKSVSPHDSTGANLIVQVKANKVMRVVPFENDAVNECWIADRDRFSYEALNADDRLTAPMLKQDGQWKTVDWQTALEYVANGLKQIKADHGAESIGALVSPHSTLEEMSLLTKLIRGLGSDNIDHRLRHAEFAKAEGVRWLGTSITSLSNLQRVLVIGSSLRKDHPLFAQRIRQSVRRGAKLSVINAAQQDWAMPVANMFATPAASWTNALADVVRAISAHKAVNLPTGVAPTSGLDPAAEQIAASLLSGDRKAILLGNAAAHHAQASSLLALANWIGAETGASVGYLTEAANTVGAMLVGAQPKGSGKNVQAMLAGELKAAIVFNTEPEHDSAARNAAVAGLSKAQMCVTLSPFKTNMAFSDVLLPIAPFTETSGSFVNADGLVQSFHAVVKPLGDTRPGWKVLRVLGTMLGLPGFDADSSQEELAKLDGVQGAQVRADRMSNSTHAAIDLSVVDHVPVTAGIYKLDGLVRRSPSLQLTADARAVRAGEIA